jgi:hypothetical protein
MSIFAVMVRIEYGDDYSDRYAKTVEFIHKEAGGSGNVWEEPTSTYIFASAKSAQALSDAIYYGTPLLDSRDTLVVVNLSAKGPGTYAQRGAKYPNTLNRLMDAR